MKGIMEYYEECYGVHVLSSVVLPVTHGATHIFAMILSQVV